MKVYARTSGRDWDQECIRPSVFAAGELEQVYVTGLKRRTLRLEWMCGLGLVLLVSLATAAAAHGQNLPTQTTLRLATPGASQSAATVSVFGADGQPASGVVTIEDGDRQLAQAVLNAAGEATANLTLPAGPHVLRAVYQGTATLQASTSASTQAVVTGGSPNYQLSLAPIAPSTLPMTLTAGTTGSVTVTVTPVNNAALTAPMFVTLSCSGLPNQASCSFSPDTVEILATTPASCPAGSPASACPPTSLMTITTQAAGTAGPHAPADRQGTPITIGFLLPGVLGLGGLAWGARRRRWLQRLSLVALVGLVSTLGMTACNPYYYYYNHGPTPAPATPPGTYTVTVTAQSNNGVTALSNSTTMVLTVK